MKTLYVNINSKPIPSSDDLVVKDYDLTGDFFFYLGERIGKGCKIPNENALITDFNTPENKQDYDLILSQWNEVKRLLFGEEVIGSFNFELPSGYLHWLRYNDNEDYNHVYEANFSNGGSRSVTIDLEELYEDSVEALQRKIMRKLNRDDLYHEIDKIVFNDEDVSRKSKIVCAIKEKYDSIGFITYKKWLQEHEDTGNNNGNDISNEDNLEDLYVYAVCTSGDDFYGREQKYIFLNCNGQSIDEYEYYIIADEHQYDCHVKSNLLVMRTNEDFSLYYLSPNGKFYKVGKYDCKKGQDFSDIKSYWNNHVSIIQNRYILYRDGLNHILYEICKNGQLCLLSKFQSKINFVNTSAYISQDLLTNGRNTVNWKTGELISISSNRYCVILGYDNGSPIYLIPSNKWNPEKHDYIIGSVMDSGGKLLWNFHAEFYEQFDNDILAIYNNGKYKVVNLKGETIIKSVERIDTTIIGGIKCLLFDEKIYIISKGIVVDYLGENVYMIVSESMANVYNLQTDEFISSFRLKGVCFCDGDGEYNGLVSISDIYVIKNRGEQRGIYSISHCKKIYTPIGNEILIGTKNNKFVIEGETCFEIYDNRGNLLKVLERQEKFVGASPQPILHDNGYISWLIQSKNRLEYFDTDMNPYYCDIKNLCKFNDIRDISVVSKECVIVDTENRSFLLKNNNCIYSGFRLEELDENNFYGCDYEFEDRDNDWCIVNVQNGTIPVHGKCGKVYLIK